MRCRLSSVGEANQLSEALLHLITDLGDSAVLLPVAALVLVYLLAKRQPRVAGIWLAAVLLCAVLTLLGKFAGRILGAGPARPFGFSPSGHVSLATMVYGGVALLVGTGRALSQRAALTVAAVALVGAVMATRLLLNAHTPGETLVGLAIGSASLSWFAWAFSRRPSPPLRWEPLALAALALALFVHTQSLSGGVIFARWVHQVRQMLL